jgi:tetratricopeptide (TPR) repeat protein
MGFGAANRGTDARGDWKPESAGRIEPSSDTMIRRTASGRVGRTIGWGSPVKSIFAVLALCHLTVFAQAKEYGHYDIGSVVTVAEAVPGKPSATVNIAYFVQIMNDLGSHAGTYPPNFDSIDDRHRAEYDVSALSNVLDAIADNFHDKSMLLRLALLHSVGNNLDIPDSGQKAIAVFDKVLELWPNDPQANYRYGLFLAGTDKYHGNAIPFLEKAKSLGVRDADYPLGITYMSLGEKAKAMENLKSYTTRVPGDENAARVLDAVTHDQVDFKQLKSSP